MPAIRAIKQSPKTQLIGSNFKGAQEYREITLNATNMPIRNQLFGVLTITQQKPNYNRAQRLTKLAR
jgi:hypothetical protein